MPKSRPAKATTSTTKPTPTRTREKKLAPLTPERYAALVEDTRSLVRAAESAGAAEKIRTHWRLGKRIARERLAQRAGYHNTVLRELSADASVTIRTLQRSVQLHRFYPEPPAKSGLTWLHYVTLLQLPSQEDRDRFEQRAIASSLTVRQLAAAIRAEQHQAPDGAFRLERPATPSYLYAAELRHIVDGDTVILDVDLGFEVYRRQRIRFAQVDAPELPTPEGRAARDFVAARLLPARTVVIKTRRVDLHGRYVAHIFYSDQEMTIDECFERGGHLNDELLREGHARVV